MLWLWLFLFVAVTLIVAAILALVMTEARKEVPPATALVYNNIWTGNLGCILPGTGFIVPGIHRVLEKEVSLRNEAENPSNVALMTGDGVEIEVDYVVRRIQVGYPGMPTITDPALDQNRLEECAIKAATSIAYAERRDKVLTRIVAALQSAVERRTLNELIPGSDLETGKTGQIDTDVMNEIEREVNTALIHDIVTADWGFWVEMDLEDYNLPRKIQEAREAASAAEIAGRAIADKAAKAGIDPKWVLLADTLSGMFGRTERTPRTAVPSVSRKEEKKEGSGRHAKDHH